MKAEHDGHCPICQQPIFEDDDIEPVDGDWCHKQCADDYFEEDGAYDDAS